MHLTFIIGTRPEIIKTAPVIREARRRRIRVSVIHTGQHHADEMSGTFYRQLRLKQPDIVLRKNRKNPNHRFPETVRRTAAWHLRRLKPDMVLVQGDTDSVLGGALAARDCGIPVGHIEAGLRSFDSRNREERNRIRVDRISSLLFCPTAVAMGNLEKERTVTGKLFLTGNPIADLIRQYHEDVRSVRILDVLQLSRKQYALLTIHRRETTGTKRHLENILKAISGLDLRVVFPVHPRTLEVLEKMNLMDAVPPNLELVSPLPYLFFLGLMKLASLVLTDSGGVQEECCLLHTPCVTLREYTERPETVTLGVNILAGYSSNAICRAAGKIGDGPLRRQRYISPYGPGDAAQKIITAIQSSIKA